MRRQHQELQFLDRVAHGSRPRPPGGSQPRASEKEQNRQDAEQKLGTPTARPLKPEMSQSRGRCCRTAASTPVGIATTTETAMAATPSSSVAGCVGDQLGYWRPRKERHAEVAMHDVVQPDDVLKWQRLIQTVCLADSLNRLRVGVFWPAITNAGSPGISRMPTKIATVVQKYDRHCLE